MKPLLSIALLIFAAAIIEATTVKQPTFEQLVEEADQVVVAEVVSSAAKWRTNLAGRLIFTLVQFQVAETLKGRQNSDLTLSFLGGTVGENSLEVSGIPHFVKGDRVILFVSSNRTEICPLVGMYYGKFNLRIDHATRAEIVTRHDGKPVLSEPTAQSLKSFRPPRSLTPAEFKQRIRNHVATTAR
jgi:hypothetical protein